MEIELTAKRADVILEWVVDTFDDENGRTMRDLKDQILATSNIGITRKEYAESIIEKVGETEFTETLSLRSNNKVRHEVHRFRYNLP